MSYDLDLFLPPPHGDPLAAARAAYEGRDSGPPVPRSGWRERIEALGGALAEADPTLVREQLRESGEHRYMEVLCPEDDDVGLQVVLLPDVAFVHLAYWHAGADARAAWEQAWAALRLLERDGGFRTYDPQLDRLLDLDADLDAVLAEYARRAERTASIAAAPPPAPSPAPPRPWWKFWG